MTPIEALHLFPYLASVYPVASERDAAARFWQALFGNVDDADALMAIVRLVLDPRDISLGDVYIEACRIRAKRPARHPEPDDLDGLHQLRDELPSVVTLMLARRVPCPWCGAGRGQACTFGDGSAPPPGASVHPMRLVAAVCSRPGGVPGVGSNPRTPDDEVPL
jgi:hypothetical protein